MVFKPPRLGSEIIYPENHIPNWHKNLEILYCTEGKGNVMCSGKNYDFRPGNIFIVNSENTHMITANETVKYHCIIIDHSFLQSSCLDVSETEFCALIDDEKADKSGDFNKRIRIFLRI